MSQLMHGFFFGTVHQQSFKSGKLITELSNDGIIIDGNHLLCFMSYIDI